MWVNPDHRLQGKDLTAMLPAEIIKFYQVTLACRRSHEAQNN